MKDRHFASELFDKRYDLIYEIIIESKSIINTKKLSQQSIGTAFQKEILVKKTQTMFHKYLEYSLSTLLIMVREDSSSDIGYG